MIKRGGVGETLFNVLKHPTTLGTLGGGLVGGGLGYITPDDPALRLRSALVGAGTGAVLGGLGGALMSVNVTPDQLRAVARESRQTGYIAGKALGRREGAVAVARRLPIDDETKAQMIETVMR